MISDSPLTDASKPERSNDNSDRVAACVRALLEDQYCLGKLTVDAVETAISRRQIIGMDIDAVWARLQEHKITIHDVVESEKDDSSFAAIPSSLIDDDRFPMPCLRLLTAEEEIELARRYNAGRHLLSHAECELSAVEWARACRSRDAHAILAISNFRLVYSYASTIENKSAFSLDDVIQAGVLGLLRAIEKYEPAKGFRFSTYATWWIRQSVMRASANLGRTIRVPIHCFQELNELAKKRRRLAFKLNRRPTVRELASDLNLDRDKVSFLLQVERDAIAFSTISGQSDGQSILENIPAAKSSRHVDPQAEAMKDELRDLMSEVVATLPKRTAYIIRERFGLEGVDPKTLEMLAQKLGITRERVRQIQAKGLEKLRGDRCSNRLEAYLPDQESEYD